jgi:putative transposase
MSRKYKFSDNDQLHFVSFAVVGWIDLFIRENYRNILVDSISFCQQNKDLNLYAWCIMTSHVHLIISSRGTPLSSIMRDLKRHTSEELRKAIRNNTAESRKEWMFDLMESAGRANSNNRGFQLWQQDNHPIVLDTEKIMHQKLDYLHHNPVEAGFVTHPEDWLYSSAGDYEHTRKGLLEVILIEPMLVTI